MSDEIEVNFDLAEGYYAFDCIDGTITLDGDFTLEELAKIIEEYKRVKALEESER